MEAGNVTDQCKAEATVKRHEGGLRLCEIQTCCLEHRFCVSRSNREVLNESTKQQGCGIDQCTCSRDNVWTELPGETTCDGVQFIEAQLVERRMPREVTTMSGILARGCDPSIDPLKPQLMVTSLQVDMRGGVGCIAAARFYCQRAFSQVPSFIHAALVLAGERQHPVVPPVAREVRCHFFESDPRVVGYVIGTRERDRGYGNTHAEHIARVVEEIREKRGVVASNSPFIGINELTFANGRIRKESARPGEMLGGLVIQSEFMAEHPQGEMTERELRIDGYGFEERLVGI